MVPPVNLSIAHKTVTGMSLYFVHDGAVFSWDSSIVKCTKIHKLLYVLTLGSGLSIDGQHLLVILGQN